VPVFAESSPQY